MHQILQITPTVLNKALRECLVWCAPHIDMPVQDFNISRVFRSSKLADSAKSVFPDSCHTKFTPELHDRFDQFRRVRSSLNNLATLQCDRLETELHRERSLLITDWEASLFDGATMPETNGFIDSDGMPPWDTWLAIIHVEESVGEACLLSWVPAWMAAAIESAIVVDAAESLSWLKLSPDGAPFVSGWGLKWAA